MLTKHVGTDNYALYGQENNGSTWALAKMNMFLHDVTSARIEWGDTLNNPLLVEDDKLMKFEVVVANPPFSLDKWGADGAEKDKYKRFHRGIPPKSVADYAFISHMIETTQKANGRMAVVVPQGVLFRSGAEGKIRQKLIEENLLDAVIGLPAGLFYGTPITAAILVLKRNRNNNEIIMIDASKDFLPDSPQNKLRSQDIKKILDTYRNRVQTEKYSSTLSFSGLQANEFNLNISRYVDTFEAEPLIDIQPLNTEIERINKELNKLELRLQNNLKELGL
jgi:type I restriction enzyme M protein